MKARHTLVRINFPGGIISPGYLNTLLAVFESVQISELCFGSRQQMLAELPTQHADLFKALCEQNQIEFVQEGQRSGNIVSSLPAAGIFIQDTWLHEGIYKEIFDLFDYVPQLKVNVNDNQTFVPLFTGNINWIAAQELHFWYLYLRLPQSNQLFRWPHLIYTNDLCRISRMIELLVLEHPEFSRTETDEQRIVQMVNERLAYISKPVEKDLLLPRFHLPYYEGFNPHGKNFWLGIYRRDEKFSVSFLKDLCTLCLQTRVSELYVSTWKSLIIKGIEKEHRRLWDFVLGKHRVNVRHAANELNWVIEDDCEDGLIIKRHVIRYFDKADARTYGLCFSVNLKSPFGMFGSIIIKRKQVKNPARLKYMERYSIYYSRSFNPNESNLVLFRDEVQKEHLGPYLVALCKKFYETESSQNMLAEHRVPEAEKAAATEKKKVFQCCNCLTVYDESVGDPDQQVCAGTTFHELPKDYACPLCETSKSDFKEAEWDLHLQSL